MSNQAPAKHLPKTGRRVFLVPHLIHSIHHQNHIIHLVFIQLRLIFSFSLLKETLNKRETGETGKTIVFDF
jgi:hypothetical protein